MRDHNILHKNLPRDLEYDDNITLFRYMDADKFYHFLQSKVYLLTQIAHIQNRGELPLLENLVNNINGNNTIGAKLTYEVYSQISFSSSWVQNPHETIDMWERYTNQKSGIAIKTNAKKLYDALNLAPLVFDDGTRCETFIKKIKYVRKSEINDIKSLSNDDVKEIVPFLHYYKPIAYENENEVRIGYLGANRDYFMEYMSIESKEHSSTLLDRIKERLKSIHATSHGVYIPYEDKFSELIEEIRISPFAIPSFKSDVSKMINIINNDRLSREIGKFNNISVQISELIGLV